MQGAKLSKKKPKKVTTKKKNVPKEQTQNDYGMDYDSNKKLADHQKKIYKSIEQTILDKARGHRERFTLLK